MGGGGATGALIRSSARRIHADGGRPSLRESSSASLARGTSYNQGQSLSPAAQNGGGGRT